MSHTTKNITPATIGFRGVLALAAKSISIKKPKNQGPKKQLAQAITKIRRLFIMV
jgi:hypothetical protein